MDLDSSTILNFKLGSPNIVGNSQNDLIQVNGNLILAGKLNIDAASGFGDGVYPLFNYGGALTNDGLDILSMPNGYDASKLYVQAGVIPGQINLLVSEEDELYKPSSSLTPDPETPTLEVPGSIFSKFQF